MLTTTSKKEEIFKYKMRHPNGISRCSPSMERIMLDLQRFTSTPEVSSTVKVKPQLQSMLVVDAGGSGGADDNGGAGAALACWAAVDASNRREADHVRLVTSLDLLSAGGGDEEARAAALVERFSEAGEMFNSLLVLDDVDQLCAGSGPGGYSSIMLATLRALLRSPPASSNTAKTRGHSQGKKTKAGRKRDKTLRILAATSRSDAACVTLHELFDETLVVKPLRPHISSKLRHIYTSKPNTTAAPGSILEKKGTPKVSSPRSVIQDIEQKGSTSDLIQVLDIKKQVSTHGIKFADTVEVYEISSLRDSAIDLCFYSQNEISNFRHEAFLEDCGLDASEYD
jgi:hypothetical protein